MNSSVRNQNRELMYTVKNVQKCTKFLCYNGNVKFDDIKNLLINLFYLFIYLLLKMLLILIDFNIQVVN